MSDPEQTEQSSKKRQTRGASFPSLSLPDAVSAITTIAAMGAHHTKDEIAEYLGHTTTNSGAFASKYASLRDFGFLSGRGNEIEVASLGMQVAHPESDTAKAEAIRQAFRRSETFNSVFESLKPGAVLQKEHIASRAVHQFDVSPTSKTDFIESFVASAVAAGIAEEVGEDEFKIVGPSESEEEEEKEKEHSPADSPPPSRHERGDSAGYTKGDGVPVVHHTWQLEDGQMLFQVTVSGSLPAKAYGQIQSIIEQGDALAQLLGPSEAAATATDDLGEEVVT